MPTLRQEYAATGPVDKLVLDLIRFELEAMEGGTSHGVERSLERVEGWWILLDGWREGAGLIWEGAGGDQSVVCLIVGFGFFLGGKERRGEAVGFFGLEPKYLETNNSQSRFPHSYPEANNPKSYKHIADGISPCTSTLSDKENRFYLLRPN